MKSVLQGLFLLIFMVLPYFYSPAATIILTSDQQLNDLTDPDKKIDMSTGHIKRIASLRDVCESAQQRGDKILTIAFDEFFRQYRDQAETERLLTPDMDEYVENMKVIADFAADYGMGMGLSLLSPLELGPAFKKQTGKTGQWLHYKVGLRNAETGKFNVQLWQQLAWTNNKGKFPVKLNSVKAYAFKEDKVPNAPFKVVNRDDIVEINDVQFEEWGSPASATEQEDPNLDPGQWTSVSTSGNDERRSKRVSVFSDGSDELKGFNRVLVVIKYDVPEMEYFSPEATPFLKELLKKYHDNGIQIEHFYSDEMHIQQDWGYFSHHDNGQLAVRYYSKAMGDLYEEQYGVLFEEKDILYFAYGPDIFSNNADAVRNVQYVRGETREEIHRTYLFRDRYYKLLNNHVVDLFKDAKAYASELFNVDDFGTSGHSSWAESPTVDLWDVGELEPNPNKYEYTSNFIWGNTVHQAAAACYDYFKWGEYLEPTRNDFAELGWNDRNYYGAAMATSLGVLNRIPNAYPAFWGMPDQVKVRKAAINDAFGGRPRSRSFDLITGHVHRDVDVLILYPMSLVAAEERFGSWMAQYGYANYITAEKLLEHGTVNEEGEILVKNRKYTTLVAMFEPVPQKGVLDMMENLSQKGGKAIWFGPPPILNGEGEKCLGRWQDIFGINESSSSLQGLIASGKRIDFSGQLDNIPSQYILTDFMIDHIYPVEANWKTTPLAFCENDLLVGTGHNNAYYFGFRPRDDQSASLGYETRTLFEILSHTGAYKPTGVFPGVNDNTEYISRTTSYLATRFPNNATVLVRHYRTHKENWPGGFSREQEVDDRILEENPLPSDRIQLDHLKVNGHDVTFNGRLAMAFRMNDRNELIAFEGRDCSQVTIDGKTYSFSSSPLQKIAFAPPLSGNKNEMKVFVQGEASVAIPLCGNANPKKLRFTDNKGEKLEYKLADNAVHFDVTGAISGKWLMIEW
jgi:hypothetical protein